VLEKDCAKLRIERRGADSRYPHRVAVLSQMMPGAISLVSTISPQWLEVGLATVASTVCPKTTVGGPRSRFPNPSTVDQKRHKRMPPNMNRALKYVSATDTKWGSRVIKIF
jgi:hypothetical protein